MKFVDLVKYKFVTEPRYYFYGWSKSPRILARPSAVKALVKARFFLPEGYNFKIWDGQRTRKIQIAMAESMRRRLRLMYPEFSERESAASFFPNLPAILVCGLRIRTATAKVAPLI